MTLIIQKPTGAKLNLAKNYPADDDSRAYIAAVEAADGQSLESGVKMAIDAFVLGCKADGIWTAIKASCILAGARTLTGALVPLVGTAPTSFAFINADYDRKTGLDGNRSTKYLNSNRANNADPQDNKHVSTFMTVYDGSAGDLIASNETAVSGSTVLNQGNNMQCRLNGAALSTFSGRNVNRLQGFRRATSSTVQGINGGVVSSFSQLSSLPTSADLYIFGAPNGLNRSGSRLAFYSIGESLDLALLDARVTTLINAFAAAIP
jgi:hypothetical protein